MASILKVDEMQGVTSAGDITITGEGGSATQSLQQGLVKAWWEAYNWAVADNSFNVSSLTDNSAGSNDTNFTNTFADAHVTLAGTSGDADGIILFDRDFDASNKKRVLHFGALTASGSYNDNTANAVFCGDLA